MNARVHLLTDKPEDADWIDLVDARLDNGGGTVTGTVRTTTQVVSVPLHRAELVEWFAS